jgi:hypothetical protein
VRIRNVIHVDSRAATLLRREAPLRCPVEDPAALVATLVAAGAPPVALLVDVLDEEHQRTTLPRVGRLDRGALLARRLARAFPRTPLRTAQVLPGPAAADQELVLSGLTRPEPVQALLAALESARIPVAGVYSPALLTPALLRRLGIAAGAVLLVTRQSDDSLRHTLVRGGRFAGSRLIRAGIAATAVDGERLVQQVEESVRYFDPAFASSGTALEVLVLADPGQQLAVPAALPDYLQVRLLTTDFVAGRLQLASPLRAAAGEDLFARLLRRGECHGDFAGPGGRRYFRLWQYRQAGRVAAVALATLAGAATGLNVLATLQARNELAAIEPQLAAIAAIAPPVPASAGPDAFQMKQAVDTLELLGADSVDPAMVLAAIGRATRGQEAVQIDALDWRRTGTATRPAGEAAGPAADATASDSDTDADTVTGAGTGGTARTDRRVLLTIRGHIAPFDGDYPGAFAALDGFVAALRAQPEVRQVRATATPLDVNPRSTMAGEVTPGVVAGEAGFVLQVSLSFDHA